MRKHRRPPNLKDVEMSRLRDAWQKAREGDQDAKDLLLKALFAHKSVDAFVRYWTELKAVIPPEKERS